MRGPDHTDQPLKGVLKTDSYCLPVTKTRPLQMSLDHPDHPHTPLMNPQPCGAAGTAQASRVCMYVQSGPPHKSLRLMTTTGGVTRPPALVLDAGQSPSPSGVGGVWVTHCDSVWGWWCQ